jgi:DNA-binding transcriptional MerR regulator
MDNINFTFKEICEKTGYASSAIRYYEKEFRLEFPRDANGRRIFTKIEFDKLLFIKELQDKNYTNSQIKKIFLENHQLTSNSFEEMAITTDRLNTENLTSVAIDSNNDTVIRFIDKRFNELSHNIGQLNESINSKERDILITENAKLKMEVKRKAYEIIELKENLRYVKDKKKGLFKRLFS